MVVFRCWKNPSNPGKPYSQENNNYADRIKFHIPPLCPDVVNHPLSNLNSCTKTQNIEGPSCFSYSGLTQEQGNDSRRSKEQEMDKEVAGPSRGSVQP